MIEKTFIILKKVGYITEKNLWRNGILNWRDFLEKDEIPRISSYRKKIYDLELEHAIHELERKNSLYFSKTLYRCEHWRLFENFKKHALYLDIETTGLNPENSEITTVTLYKNGRAKTFVKGFDLEKDVLKREIEDSRLLVTFYGSVFDLPFLEKKFGLRFDLPHFDLCFAARRIGLRGGLKIVEKNLGIERAKEILGIDGLEAVRLWKRYEKGDTSALELLIRYNREDTVNLEEIARKVYEKLKASIERFSMKTSIL